MSRDINLISSLVLVMFFLSACDEALVTDGVHGPTSTPSLLNPSVPTPAPVPGSPTITNEQAQVLALVNTQRIANGLQTLVLNQSLVTVAQNFAQAMATQGFFSHNSPDGSTPGQRIESAGYEWRTWGENIAYGYKTPEEVMNGWMNSSGHRASILNANFKEIGIGFAINGSGTAYWVQDFGAR